MYYMLPLASFWTTSLVSFVGPDFRRPPKRNVLQSVKLKSKKSLYQISILWKGNYCFNPCDSDFVKSEEIFWRNGLLLVQIKDYWS